MSILTVSSLSSGYGKKQVLRDVSLSIEKNEFISILGPSGSGKSTLLHCIAGLEVPWSGEILLGDRCVAGNRIHIPPQQRKIGYLFQDYALFPHLRVMDNVSFGIKKNSNARQQATALLESLKIETLKDKYPHELSGGQKQRVALARSLAVEPQLLLLDEPFSSLDENLRGEVIDFTMDALRRTQTSALMVTHNPDEALRFSDRIIILSEGTILQTAHTLEILRAPRHLWTAKLFHITSQLNFSSTFFKRYGIEKKEGCCAICTATDIRTQELDDKDIQFTCTVQKTQATRSGILLHCLAHDNADDSDTSGKAVPISFFQDLACTTRKGDTLKAGIARDRILMVEKSEQ